MKLKEETKNALLVILLVICGFMFLKDFGRNKKIKSITKDVDAIVDTMYTKTQFEERLKSTTIYWGYALEMQGLKTENRFYQASNRTPMEVTRQADNEKRITELTELMNKLEEEWLEDEK